MREAAICGVDPWIFRIARAWRVAPAEVRRWPWRDLVDAHAHLDAEAAMQRAAAAPPPAAGDPSPGAN